jgi:hypothetical protein
MSNGCFRISWTLHVANFKEFGGVEDSGDGVVVLSLKFDKFCRCKKMLGIRSVLSQEEAKDVRIGRLLPPKNCGFHFLHRSAKIENNR